MDKVYKKVEVVGVSDSSVTDAVETAIARASETIQNISWFEVRRSAAPSPRARSRSIRSP